MIKLSILALILLLPGCFNRSPDVRAPASEGQLDSRFLIVDGFEKPFNLNQASDVKGLKDRFLEMKNRLKADTRPEDSENRKWPKYFCKSEELSDKKLKKSIQFMLTQLDRLENNPALAPDAIIQFQEMNRALLLNFVSPVEDHYTVSEAIGMGWKDLFRHPFMRGKVGAKSPRMDLWEDAGEISQKSLKLGFNRESSSFHPDQICDYEEPKTGYGTRPGFTILCDNKKIKIKFKEIHSEPFTTRIFWALGYHVEPVDFASAVRIHYDRRIIDEFNSRKKMMLRLTFLGKKVMEKPYAKTFDATEFMDHLLLKDGSKVEHGAIHDFLFDEKGEFKKEHEIQISEVVTLPAQVQESNDGMVKVGPWSFNDFDHMDRREMRALVVLAAWLNWYDVRFDNNRVALVEDQNGQPQMQMLIGDVGSAMGNVSKLIHFLTSKIERPDLFSDRFTATHHGEFRIKNYFHLIDENKAFNEATPEDARWIGRLMLKLKPEQIHDALIGSGFSAAEADAFQVKLLKRLEFMKSDLGL